jgi:hypothetical protein
MSQLISCIERNAVLIINDMISLAAAVLTHPELIWWVCGIQSVKHPKFQIPGALTFLTLPPVIYQIGHLL